MILVSFCERNKLEGASRAIADKGETAWRQLGNSRQLCNKSKTQVLYCGERAKRATAKPGQQNETSPGPIRRILNETSEPPKVASNYILASCIRSEACVIGFPHPLKACD